MWKDGEFVVETGGDLWNRYGCKYCIYGDDMAEECNNCDSGDMFSLIDGFYDDCEWEVI